MGSNGVSPIIPNGDKKKVCIVGGGPAGLVSLRWVLNSPKLTGTIFEQKDNIGGLWNYNGKKTFATSSRNLRCESRNGHSFPGDDPECITTMYDNLRCNVAYVELEFLDFPHKKVMDTYPTQQEMHEYMKDYASHFNLWPNINVNTAIVDIRPENPDSADGEPCKWIVQTHEHVKDIYHTEIFDAVMICTGKNSYPHCPKIPGLDQFKGKVMHSKYFKNGEGFQDKNVVCVGLGPTSGDIATILSKQAKKITICHKFFAGYCFGLLPSNVRETKNVKLVTSDGVITDDEEVIPCDVIILCTGYRLEYPFLNADCGLEVIEGKYIPHLYNMTVFTKHPSLSIINMCYRSPEIVLSEIQARYFVSYLEGSVKLPSFKEMEAAVEAEEAEKIKQGLPYSVWFQIGDFVQGEAFDYFLRIAKEAGVQDDYKHLPLLHLVWKTTVSRIFGKHALYRQDKFRKVSDTRWEIELSSSSEFPESKRGKVVMTLNADGSASEETT